MSTIPVRSSSSARVDGLRRLAHTLRRNELGWLVAANYDDYAQVWLFDVLRQGAKGGWVIQRFSYDLHNDIQHYRGETAVADNLVRATRAKAQEFDIAAWQDGTAE
jgi:hypothetical protein